MIENDKIFALPEYCIEKMYNEIISEETNDIFTDEMQESLRKEGYEHFRDRLYIKLDDGRYIFNSAAISPREPNR